MAQASELAHMKEGDETAFWQKVAGDEKLGDVIQKGMRGFPFPQYRRLSISTRTSGHRPWPCYGTKRERHCHCGCFQESPVRVPQDREMVERATYIISHVWTNYALFSTGMDLVHRVHGLRFLADRSRNRADFPSPALLAYLALPSGPEISSARKPHSRCQGQTKDKS